MDREKYLQMRRTGQYDFAWFYEYYVENKEPRWRTYDFQSFVNAFNMTFQFDAKTILNTIDKKLDVTKIENDQGHLLYIN